MILKNMQARLSERKNLSPTSKARREPSRNKFMETIEMPDRVERFEEADFSKNRPRTRLEFV